MGLITVVNAPLILAQVEVDVASVIVGLNILRVEADGLIIVLNGLVKLPLAAVGSRPIDVGHSQVGVKLNGLVAVGDG